MGNEILIPQGTYRVGRDIPAGVYIITALNKLSYVTIADDYDEREWYTLDEEHGNSCHFEVKTGDLLKIEGKVKIKRISSFISGDSDYVAHDQSQDNDSICVAKTLADQWNINLNRFYNDAPSRLQRGMDYMQSGKVQSIVINKGLITAKVSGSRDKAYNITVRIDTSKSDGRDRLPTKEQISFECNCSDEVRPCKHIAAVLYAISDKGKDDIKVFDELL